MLANRNCPCGSKTRPNQSLKSLSTKPEKSKNDSDYLFSLEESFWKNADKSKMNRFWRRQKETNRWTNDEEWFHSGDKFKVCQRNRKNRWKNSEKPKKPSKEFRKTEDSVENLQRNWRFSWKTSQKLKGTLKEKVSRKVFFFSPRCCCQWCVKCCFFLDVQPRELSVTVETSKSSFFSVWRREGSFLVQQNKLGQVYVTFFFTS